MNKLITLFSLFRRGEAIADPEVLHDKDKLILAITALITALGNAAPQFGFDLGWLTPDVANLLAGGIAAVYIGVQHYISSPNRGLPAKPEPAGNSQDDLRGPGA
jgi:hypothetical protein